MACHYRVAVAGRAGRPAGGEARADPRRGRHAAAAAAGGRRQGRGDVRRRRTRSAPPTRWPPASSTSSSRATCCRARSPSRESRREGRAAAQDARPQRRSSATPPANAPIFAAVREQVKKKARGLIAPLKAVEAVEAAVTLPFAEGCKREARALPRVPLLGPVEGADPRLLRRARGRQDSRHRQGHAADPDPPRRGRRRRHDGRRHRHDLRQRRHPGAPQGGRPAGPRPRPGDDPQELRQPPCRRAG